MFDSLVGWAWWLLYLAAAIWLFGVIKSRINKKLYSLNLIEKHVVVTGGSEGLGLQLAIQCF
jgi:cell division ATPase FtsA